MKKNILFLIFLYLLISTNIFSQPFNGIPTGDEVVATTQYTLEEDLFNKVDQVRQDTFGLPPLIRCTRLDYASRYHTWDMKTVGYFCHSTNDAGGPDACFGYTNLAFQCDRPTRIQLFCGSNNNDECLGYGQTSANQVVEQWLTEPSHRNILSGGYTHAGVGVVIISGSQYYWTLNVAYAICCETDTTNDNASICNGDSIYLGGAYQTTAGTYYDNLTNENGCDSVVETILTVDQIPTTAAAGSDQNVCVSTTTLAGNTPSIGTGSWSVISGTATITTPSSPTSGVTGLVVGSATLRWTISNGSCNASTNDVVITRDNLPTTSSAGDDQTVCDSTATLAGNTPTVGTGLWSVISGTATITTPSSPTSGVTGLIVGSATLRWTITNGSCTASTDDVIITRVVSDTYSWTGTVNTDWNNTGNWDSGIVPGKCNPVMIPGTAIAPNQPVISTAGMKCKNITINQSDGGKVTISGSGTLTVSD